MKHSTLSSLKLFTAISLLILGIILILSATPLMVAHGNGIGDALNAITGKYQIALGGIILVLGLLGLWLWKRKL